MKQNYSKRRKEVRYQLELRAIIIVIWELSRESGELNAGWGRKASYSSQESGHIGRCVV